MKVRPSVKPMCEHCKVIKRHGRVMVICPACEKPTRIKHAVVDGKKVRVCKKCGEQLDAKL